MIEQKDILDYVKKEGYKITPRMLRYWQSSGLIPQPEVSFPGRGKGSKSTYPDGTDKQALAICKLPPKARSEVEVSWSLWKLGFSVSPEVTKGILRDTLKSLKNFVAKIQDKESGGVSSYALDTFISPDALDPFIPPEDAEDAEKVPKKHSSKELFQPHGVLRDMSKKLGAKKYFPTLLYFIALVYVEPTDPYDDDLDFLVEEHKIDKEAFSAAVDEILPSGMLLPAAADPYPILAEIRKLVDPTNLEKCLHAASDATLRTAYQEIDAIYNFLWKAYYMLKVLFEGKQPRKNIEFEKLPANEQALWLLLWLSLRGNDRLYQAYKELSKGVIELLEARSPAEEPFI